LSHVIEASAAAQKGTDNIGMTSRIVQPALVHGKRFPDERGYFTETYNARRFAQIGLVDVFVQDNHSYSRARGTLRGLHFQAPPHEQAKLVRVVRGRIRDVAVDLRRGSLTYGHHISVELSANDPDQLYLPAGYAHGFVTLEADTEVAYKVTKFYDKASEGGVRWDDPTLHIDWGIKPSDVVVSKKDEVLPFLPGFASPFTYDGNPMELIELG
jgi:dTDP-4-dehydrorhamnose 3,5-epimerase